MRIVQNLLVKCCIPLQLKNVRQFKNINSVRLNSSYKNYVDDVDDQIYKYEKCINEVSLLGRVGADPIFSKRNGKPFVQFLLATSRATEEDLVQRKQDLHTIFTFNPVQIKSIKTFVKKGHRLYVSGKLVTTNLVDSNTNNSGVLLHRYISFS